MDSLIALSHGAPIAALLLATMIAVSLAGLSKWPLLIERNMFRPYWLVRQREYATLITSGFIHADLPHLLFNGFTFYAFAFQLERELGSASFTALYLFGLLVSDAGSWFKHYNDPGYRTLGASGAILAVLFASILYFPTQSLYIFPLPIPIPAPVFAVAYLAYTWWAARRGVGRVNHDAHFSGALAGIAYVAMTDADTLRHAIRAMLGSD